MIAFEIAMQLATLVAAGDYKQALELCAELEDVLKINLDKEEK